MRIAVILTAYYGLCRSEVLGIKWSAIDWTENIYSHVDHTSKLESAEVIGNILGA